MQRIISVSFISGEVGSCRSIFWFWFFSVFLAPPSFLKPPWFEWLLGKPFPIWSYATFTQNFFMGPRGNFGPNWLGITWSLAVEEQFYLVVPLLIYFLPRRILLGTFLVAILVAPALRCAFSGFIAEVQTPWRSDSLLSGASLAVLVRWHPFVTAVRQHRRFLLILFLTLLGGAVVMTLRPQRFGAFNHFWLASLACLPSSFLALVGSERHSMHWLRSPILVWFGQVSYGDLHVSSGG